MTHLNTTLEIRSIPKGAYAGNLKKGELFSLIKTLDRGYRSTGTTKNPGKNSARARQVQNELNLLRRYFVMRIEQSRAYSGEEGN